MDAQNFDPLFGKVAPTEAVKPLAAPEVDIDIKQFIDNDQLKAQEEGSVQYASGVVRVSDAPKYPEVVSNKPLYDESQNFGINRAKEFKAKLGLSDDQSFTEYNSQNKFVPQGFELEAKLLLHEEKVRKLESQYKNGTMGYQTFLFKAYGVDLLKQSGHDIYSSLYWYNRRKQGLFDSPLDNIPQMRILIKQSEDLYQAEEWHRASNQVTLDNTMSAYITQGVLPPEKVRELFPEVFEALDEIYESDVDKVKLYRAGLLSFPQGQMPTVDTDGDGKPDYYYHTDGKLYRVADAGVAKAGEAKAYYNADGSLDRIVTNEFLGEGGDSFIKGFAGAFYTVYEVVAGLAVGLVDTIKNLTDQDEFKFDLLENWYVGSQEWKQSEGFAGYLFGNNIYTTSTGFQNADGSIDFDGIYRGAMSAAGTITGMIVTAGIGKAAAGLKTGAQLATEAAKSAGKEVAKRTLFQGVKDLGILGVKSLGTIASFGTGLSQGQAVIPALGKTTAAATIQGLTFLAARDFTTSVASLTARQEQLGISNSDIISNSALMTGVNMGVSYLLRSTMDKSALIRHAQVSQAKMNAAMQAGRKVSSFDKGFVDMVMGFAKKTPKAFALTSTAMDMMENVITMATSASVSQTGELLNLDTLKGMFNPQTVITQLALGRMTYNGNISNRNTLNEGIRTGGVLLSLGKLTGENTKIIAELDNGITSARNKNNNVAAETLINIKNQYLKTAQSNPNDLVASLSKAMFELHKTMADPQTGDSFVRSFLKKSFDTKVQSDVIADIQLTYDYYKAAVNASNRIYKDAFVKGNLLDGEAVKGLGKNKFDSIYNKLVQMQRQVLKLELPLAKVAFGSFVTGVNVDYILKNKLSREAEVLLDKVEIISGTPTKEQVLETDKDGNPFYRTVTKTAFDTLSEESQIQLKKIIEGSGLPEDAFNYGTILRLPGMGTAEEGTKAFQDLTFVLDQAVKLSSLEENQVKILYNVGKGVYLMPSLGHDFINLKSAAVVNTLIKGIYGLRYADPKEQGNFFKGIVGILTGSDSITSDADKRVAITLLSNLLKDANTPGGKPIITYSQAVKLFNTPEMAEILKDQSLKISLPDDQKAVITTLLNFKTAVDDFNSFKTLIDEAKQKGMRMENSNDFKKFIESLSKLSDVQQQEMYKTFGITQAIFEEMKDMYLKLSSNPLKSQEYFEANLKVFLAGGKSDASDEVGNFVVKQLSTLLGASAAAENSISPELSGQQFTIRSLESATNEHKPVLEALNILGFKNFLNVDDAQLKQAVDSVYKPIVQETVVEEKVETKAEPQTDKTFKVTPLNEKTYLPYENDFKILDINGKSFSQLGERFFAVVEYKGQKLSFYFSSGEVPKDGVTPGRWYLIGGIGSDNYINKPRAKNIRNFNFSPIVRAMSEFLTDKISLPQRYEFGVKLSPEDKAFINDTLKPVTETESVLETFKIIQDKLELIDPVFKKNLEQLRAQPKEKTNVQETKTITKVVSQTLPNEQGQKVFNELKQQIVNARFDSFLKFMGVDDFNNKNSTRTNEATLRLLSIYNESNKEKMLSLLQFENLLKNPVEFEAIKTNLFKNNSILLDESGYHTSLDRRIKQAMEAHAKVYVENTKAVAGNKKLYIDLSTFQGRRMAQLAESIQNKNDAVERALKQNDVKGMLAQFNVGDVDEFARELQKERSFLARLHKKYPSGFVVFENVEAGSFPNDLRILLDGMGYGVYDLAETFGSIPGLFYKGDKLDSAIELTFKTPEEKELLKNFLNGAANEENSKLHFKKIIDIASQQNKNGKLGYDFRLAMHESVGLFTTINNDTVINLSGSPLLSDINPVVMRFSEYVDTVLANDLTIKQGRNAGNLIKMFLSSASGYGLVGDPDNVLRNNVMLISAIRGIDEFQKAELNNKADVERKFTQEELNLFRQSGLWEFVSKVNEDHIILDRPELKLETWIIKPVADFKTKALKYLSDNNSINPIVIFPLLKTDILSKLPGTVGYNPATGTTPLTTNFLNWTANSFLRTMDPESFNKFFLQDVVDINLKGHQDEEAFIQAVSNKKVSELLKPEFAKQWQDNIYYTMLSNTIRGALKINESVKNLFKDNGINFRMFEALGDYNIREIIGEGLNKNKSNAEIASDLNRYLNAGDKVTRLKIKDYKDTFIQRVGFNKEDSVVSASDIFRLNPSYSYKGLTFLETDIADIKTVLTNGDIFIKDASLLTYEALRNNDLESNDLSIIKAMLDQSSEEPSNKVNFFLNNLEALNTKQFNLLVDTLTRFGVDKKSIDLLKEKYKATEELFNKVSLPKEVRSRQTIIDNADPSFIQTDEYIYYGSPNSNINAINEARLHALNMALNPSSRKTMLKLSQTENLRGQMSEAIKSLADVIDVNNRANNGESRLIPNLALTNELGNLASSMTEFTRTLMAFDFGPNVKLSEADAFNLGWNMYIHSTGTDMSKIWTKYLFYDTKEKKVVALANELGRGKTSINKLMEVSAKYFNKDEAGRYVLFSMDKNMLHNTRVATGGKLKYMILNEPNIEIMKNIFVKNAYVQSDEFKKGVDVTPEKLKDVVTKVYARTVDLGDIKDIALQRFSNIPGVNPKLIEKVFLNMSSFKRNLNLSDQAFENSVLMGGDYSQEQKDIINLKQQYVNDTLRYLIHHSELSSDIKNELTRAFNNLIKSSEELLNTYNIKEDTIEQLNNFINKNDFVSFNQRIKSILGSDLKSLDKAGPDAKKLFNLIINYNILTTRDGKSLNLLLNESNKALLKNKDQIKNNVTATFADDSTLDLKDIAKNGFNVLDIEVFYDNDSGISKVFQVVFKTYDGVLDLESFIKNNERVKSSDEQTKVIYVPVFIDTVVDNKKTRILWNRQAIANGYSVEKVFPQYYRDYYSNIEAKGSKLAIEKYLAAMDLLPKTFKESDLKDYVQKQIEDNGKVTLTYNGKMFDVGDKVKDEQGNLIIKPGKLFDQGLINKDFFVLNKHLDVLTDVVRNTIVTNRAFNASSALDDVSKHLGLNNIYKDNHEAINDANVTAEVALRFFEMSDLIKHKQTDMFDLVQKIGDNFFQQIEGVKNNYVDSDLLNLTKINTEELSVESKDFIKDYRTLFDDSEGNEKLSKISKAINGTINDLNYYYYKIDFDVQKKKLFYESENLYENQKDYVDNLQNGGSNRLGSILEYLFFKYTKKPFVELYPDTKSFFTEDSRSKPNYAQSGGPLGQIFDLLRDSFGVSRIGQDGKTYKSLDANQIRFAFSLPEEEFFNRLVTVKTNIKGISFKDYQNNKSSYDGIVIKDFFSKALQTEEGKNLTNANARNGIVYKFINNVVPVLNEITNYSFLGNEKSPIRIKLQEEFATFAMRNNRFETDEAFLERVNRSKKFIESSEVLLAKDFLKNNNPIEINYDSIYRLVTPAVRNKKYETLELQAVPFSDLTTDSLNKIVKVNKTISSNEIGVKLKTLLRLTGFKTVEEIYNAFPNGEVYVPVMRHPGDHVGSVSMYKAVILSNENPTEIALNEDVLKGVMFGDFDGDHVTILKPNTFAQEFAKEIDPISKIAYKALDYILKDDTAFRFKSDSQRVVLLNKVSNKMFSDYLNLDYKEILNQKTELEKFNKYEELKAIRENQIIADGLEAKDLNIVWLSVADVSNAFNNKKYEFFSLNKNFGNNKDNVQAIKNVSLAKSYDFKSQSLNDTVYGQMQKTYAFLNETVKSDDPRKVFVFGGVSLTDNALELLDSNVNLAVDRLNNYVKKFNSDLIIAGKKGLSQDEISFLERYISSGTIKNSTDIVAFLNTFEKIVQGSEFFKQTLLTAIPKLNELTKQNTSEKEYQEAFNVFAKSRLVTKEGTPESGILLFDASAKQYRVTDLLLSQNGENWSAFSSDTDLLDSYIKQSLYEAENKSTKFYNSLDIKDNKGNSYQNYVEADVVIDLLNVTKSPEDTFVLLNDKLGYGKIAAITVDQFDDFVATDLKQYQNKVLKQDLQITKNITLSAGDKFLGLMDYYGEQVVLVSKQKKIDGSSKLALFQAKVGKGVLSGTPDQQITQALNKANIKGDILYSARNFNFEKFSPLFSANASNLKFFDAEGKEITKININNLSKNARFATLTSPVAVVEDSFFWNQSLKDSRLDETTFSNNARSLDGMILLGNKLINIDENGNFVYDNDVLSKMNSFWKQYKAPLLSDNNAMRMHHLNMLTVVLSKIPTATNDNIKYAMSDDKKRVILESSLTKVSFSSRQGLEEIYSLVQKYINGNGLSLDKLNLTPMEKYILSESLYSKFTDPEPVKTIEDAKDIKAKSKFYRDIRKENVNIFGKVSVDGKTVEQDRTRIDKNGRKVYVEDVTNGFYSMKNYVNSLIDYSNYLNPDQKLQPMSNSDIENGTYRNIFNYALGYTEGYQTNKFRPIAYSDAYIRDSLLNVSNNSGKTQTTTNPITISKDQMPSKFLSSDIVDDSIDYQKAYKDMNFGKRSFVEQELLPFTERVLNSDGTVITKRKAIPESTTDTRFKYELMNALANTKSALGRAALYGWAKDTYALSMSPKRLTFSPLDNQLHFVFDSRMKEVSADNLEQTIKDIYTSHKFFEYEELRKDKIKNTIDDVFKNPNDEFGYGPDDFRNINDALLDALEDSEDRYQTSIFGNAVQSKAAQVYFEMYPEKATDVIQAITDKHRTTINKGEEKNMSYLFRKDVLESRGIALKSKLDFEADEMLGDINKDSAYLKRDLGLKFMTLHSFAYKRGVIAELNEFSKLVGMVSWIDHLTKLGNQNPKEKGAYNLQIEAHLKQNGITYDEAIKKIDAFGKKNGDLTVAYVNFMDEVKMHAKTYSRLNNEVSDDWFWLVTPNVYNKSAKAKAEFMRSAIFSYSKPDSNAIGNMYMNYNFYDSIKNTIDVLGTSAAYYNFAKRATDLKLMENNTVFNLASETVEKAIEGLIPDIKVGYTDAVSEYDIFLMSAKSMLPGVIINDFKEDVNSGNLGVGLFGVYKQIKDYLNKKQITFADAQEKYRLAENDPDTKREMDTIMKAFSLSNDIIASLLMKSKNSSNVIDTIFNTIKLDAESKGLSIVDNRGRLLREDVGSYRSLGNFSSEYVSNIFKYYSPFNGGFKANVILDALNGDLFYMNKSLAEHADEYFFTKKEPGVIKKLMLKAQSVATSLLMSNPIKLPDRFLMYSGADFGFLSLANPFTMLKVGEATNMISEYLQSNGAVLDPRLKEYMLARGVDIKNQNLNTVLNEGQQVIKDKNILKPFTEPANKALSIQHEWTRFAAYLAIKEDLENNNGNGKWLGAAYQYRDLLKDAFTDKVDQNGEVIYSKEARQALFIVGRQIGSTGDFPILAKKLNGWFMFTTFPLAMARWARGEFKSLATATQDLLFSSDKRADGFRFLASQGLGVLGIYMVMNFLLGTIAQATGVDEETEEEWKEKQVAPEIVKSILLGGKPVVTPYNSFNPIQIIKEATIQPFLPDEKNPDKSLMDSIFEFGLNNIASRGNPAIRMAAELMGGVDIIGGTIYDNSDRYNMWENFFRKTGAYFIGAAGANALTNYVSKDLPTMNLTTQNALLEGVNRVFMAELGNTRAYKSDVKNYYKANNIIQTYRFAESEDTTTNSIFGNDFDKEGYQSLKSEIAQALSRKAKPAQIYSIIIKALQNGLDIKEIRSAVNNNSIQYKLNSIKDIKGFMDSLSEGELNSIKDALAYEQQMYPWLDGIRMEVEDAYRREYQSSYTPRLYIPTYGPRFPTKNYYNNNRNYYNSSNYYPVYGRQNPFSAYRSSWFRLNNLDKPQEERNR